MAKTSIKQTGMYTKAEVAKMIFPHLPARQGWKKISNFVAVTKYVKMRLNKKDTQYYLLCGDKRTKEC